MNTVKYSLLLSALLFSKSFYAADTGKHILHFTERGMEIPSAETVIFSLENTTSEQILRNMVYTLKNIFSVAMVEYKKTNEPLIAALKNPHMTAQVVKELFEIGLDPDKKTKLGNPQLIIESTNYANSGTKEALLNVLRDYRQAKKNAVTAAEWDVQAAQARLKELKGPSSRSGCTIQ